MSRQPKPQKEHAIAPSAEAKAAEPRPPAPALPSEDLFRSLAETASDAILTIDTHSTILFANRGVERIFGYPVDQVLGRSLTLLMPEYLRQVHEASLARYCKTGEKHIRWEGVELTGLHRSGREIPIEVAFGEFRQGASHFFTGMVRDLSDRKQAEDALRDSQRSLSTLLGNLPGLAFRCRNDQDWTMEFVSDGCLELTGYPPADFVGGRVSFAKIIHPDDVQMGWDIVQAALREGRPYRLTYRIRTAAGDEKWIFEQGRQVDLQNGVGVLEGFRMDISDRVLAERALMESEEKFRAVAETAPSILIFDGSRFVYANARAQELFGYSRQEFLAMGDPFQIIHPESRPALQERAAKRLRGEPVPARYDTKVLTKAGEERWVEIHATAMNFGGKPAVLSAALDITERKRADLLQSALYRVAEKAATAENLDELFAAIHAILQELMYAPNCFFALHDPATDMISFPYFVDERDPQPAPRQAGPGLTSYVLRTGQPLLATPEKLEDMVRRGEVQRVGTHSLDWLGVPLTKGDHTFGVLGLQSYEERQRYGEREKEILLFVTREVAGAIERKLSLEALRESEERFRAIAESATTLISITDGSRLLYTNPAFQQLTGYSSQELADLQLETLVHADFRELLEERRRKFREGSSLARRVEYKILTKTGAERWLEASSTRINYGGQQVSLTISVDITERKRAELLQSALYRIAEQSRSATSLQELYAGVHAVVGELMDARNFYIALHDPASQTITFPYFVDEEDVTPPLKQNVGRGLTAYVLRAGQPLLAPPEVFDEMVRRGDVEAVGAPGVDWLGVPLKHGEETFGVMVVQSYTEKIRFGEKEKEILSFVSQQVAGAIERQRAEEALRQSEARFRSMIERAVYGIYVATFEGRFLSVNPALVEMLGYGSTEELLAVDIARDLYINPEERSRLLSDLLRTGRADNAEVHWKRQDGKAITVRLRGRVVPGRRPAEGAGLEFIAEDVTAQRSLEAQFRQAQKMEAVGRLAGGVAHDFNNLLTVISGYTDLMLQGLAANDPMRAEMAEIRKAAERAALLTRQLLAFSRQQVLESRVLDLNQVVTEIAPMLHRLLGEDVRLTATLAPQLGRVQADPSQMGQVIMNLAVNARDAMPKGGQFTLETRDAILDETYARDHGPLPPGRYVMLAASDTGTGMDKETLAQVFEPFFTTKERGKGTGLGLSTVYGIVKQSGGYVWAYSEPGRGTSFKIYLPQAEVTTADSGKLAALAPAAMTTGSETILVVEDEPGVRSLSRLVLQGQGYTVLDAGGAEEALPLCERHRGTIHLLLSDVILEDVSGPELARRLLQLRPQMKVLFMSGYTDDAVLLHGVKAADTPFLQKPFSADALARKVREVLDRPEPAP